MTVVRGLWWNASLADLGGTVRRVLVGLTACLVGAASAVVGLAESADASACRQAVGVVVSPNPVVGGAKATAKVHLKCAAGVHGLALKVSSAGLGTPRSIRVPRRAHWATFKVTTPGVRKAESRWLQVGSGRLHARTTLRVLPAAKPPAPVRLSALTIAPNPVEGGNSATGTVTLTGAAPSAGLPVHLVSGNPALARVPSQITVAAHRTSAEFTIATSVVKPLGVRAKNVQASDVVVGISASTSDGRKLGPVSLTVQSRMGFTVTTNRGYVRPGHPLTGTVVLSRAAPAGGTVVSLGSNDREVTLSTTSLTIPAGATSGTFQAIAAAQAAPRQFVITASIPDVVSQSILQVRGPGNLDALSGTREQLPNGTSVTETVSLTDPVDHDSVVALASDDPDVTVPDRVIVPAGKTSAPFVLKVGTLATGKRVWVTASLDGDSVRGLFRVGPEGLSSFTVPDQVTAGQGFTGEIRPVAEVSRDSVVTLTSSDPHLVVPATVTISKGYEYVTFTGTTTGPITSPIQVTVTASWNASTLTRTITLNP
ncbi:hypothetical protein [Actinomadura gamaensis]|uniref:Uncharacterized protein n=1 Tax=Actinomadura gamaensis TaxID=1763541 RepID=A0ABV9TXG3_9ACTN